MAYNPASDAYCQAWWRLGDDTNLVTDSSGKGNTLTNSGVVDSGTAWEGSHCGDFEAGEGDSMSRADADLSAAFPLKSGVSGDMTICCAVRFESVPGSGSYQRILAKYQSAAGKRSFQLGAKYLTDKPVLYLILGYNSGNSATEYNHTGQLQAGRWYHVGFTYVESTLAYRLRVWDATAEDFLAADLTGAASGTLHRSDEVFYLGRRYDAGYYFDGLLDDVVVFNRALSVTELDAVRAMTFGDSLSVPVAAHYLNQRRRIQ